VPAYSTSLSKQQKANNVQIHDTQSTLQVPTLIPRQTNKNSAVFIPNRNANHFYNFELIQTYCTPLSREGTLLHFALIFKFK